MSPLVLFAVGYVCAGLSCLWLIRCFYAGRSCWPPGLLAVGCYLFSAVVSFTHLLMG